MVVSRLHVLPLVIIAPAARTPGAIAAAAAGARTHFGVTFEPRVSSGDQVDVATVSDSTCAVGRFNVALCYASFDSQTVRCLAHVAAAIIVVANEAIAPSQHGLETLSLIPHAPGFGNVVRLLVGVDPAAGIDVAGFTTVSGRWRAAMNIATLASPGFGSPANAAAAIRQWRYAIDGLNVCKYEKSAVDIWMSTLDQLAQYPVRTYSDQPSEAKFRSDLSATEAQRPLFRVLDGEPYNVHALAFADILPLDPSQDSATLRALREYVRVRGIYNPVQSVFALSAAMDADDSRGAGPSTVDRARPWLAQIPEHPVFAHIADVTGPPRRGSGAACAVGDVVVALHAYMRDWVGAQLGHLERRRQHLQTSPVRLTLASVAAALERHGAAVVNWTGAEQRRMFEATVAAMRGDTEMERILQGWNDAAAGGGEHAARSLAVLATWCQHPLAHVGHEVGVSLLDEELERCANRVRRVRVTSHNIYRELQQRATLLPTHPRRYDSRGAVLLDAVRATGQPVEVMSSLQVPLNAALCRWLMGAAGLDVPVHVVGVLGASGAGKSTLVNRLFGTSFPVSSSPASARDGRSGRVLGSVAAASTTAEAAEPRTATGMGITAMHVPAQDVLVLDIDGLDLETGASSQPRLLQWLVLACDVLLVAASEPTDLIGLASRLPFAMLHTRPLAPTGRSLVDVVVVWTKLDAMDVRAVMSGMASVSGTPAVDERRDALVAFAAECAGTMRKAGADIADHARICDTAMWLPSLGGSSRGGAASAGGAAATATATPSAAATAPTTDLFSALALHARGCVLNLLAAHGTVHTGEEWVHEAAADWDVIRASYAGPWTTVQDFELARRVAAAADSFRAEVRHEAFRDLEARVIAADSEVEAGAAIDDAAIRQLQLDIRAVSNENKALVDAVAGSIRGADPAAGAAAGAAAAAHGRGKMRVSRLQESFHTFVGASATHSRVLDYPGIASEMQHHAGELQAWFDDKVVELQRRIATTRHTANLRRDFLAAEKELMVKLGSVVHARRLTDTDVTTFTAELSRKVEASTAAYAEHVDQAAAQFASASRAFDRPDEWLGLALAAVLPRAGAVGVHGSMSHMATVERAERLAGWALLETAKGLPKAEVQCEEATRGHRIGTRVSVNVDVGFSVVGGSNTVVSYRGIISRVTAADGADAFDVDFDGQLGSDTASEILDWCKWCTGPVPLPTGAGDLYQVPAFVSAITEAANIVVTACRDLDADARALTRQHDLSDASFMALLRQQLDTTHKQLSEWLQRTRTTAPSASSAPAAAGATVAAGAGAGASAGDIAEASGVSGHHIARVGARHLWFLLPPMLWIVMRRRHALNVKAWAAERKSQLVERTATAQHRARRLLASGGDVTDSAKYMVAMVVETAIDGANTVAQHHAMKQAVATMAAHVDAEFEGSPLHHFHEEVLPAGARADGRATAPAAARAAELLRFLAHPHSYLKTWWKRVAYDPHWPDVQSAHVRQYKKLVKDVIIQLRTQLSRAGPLQAANVTRFVEVAFADASVLQRELNFEAPRRWFVSTLERLVREATAERGEGGVAGGAAAAAGAAAASAGVRTGGGGGATSDDGVTTIVNGVRDNLNTACNEALATIDEAFARDFPRVTLFPYQRQRDGVQRDFQGIEARLLGPGLASADFAARVWTTYWNDTLDPCMQACPLCGQPCKFKEKDHRREDGPEECKHHLCGLHGLLAFTGQREPLSGAAVLKSCVRVKEDEAVMLVADDGTRLSVPRGEALSRLGPGWAITPVEFTGVADGHSAREAALENMWVDTTTRFADTVCARHCMRDPHRFFDNEHVADYAAWAFTAAHRDRARAWPPEEGRRTVTWDGMRHKLTRHGLERLRCPEIGTVMAALFSAGDTDASLESVSTFNPGIVRHDGNALRIASVLCGLSEENAKVAFGTWRLYRDHVHAVRNRGAGGAIPQAMRAVDTLMCRFQVLLHHIVELHHKRRRPRRLMTVALVSEVRRTLLAWYCAQGFGVVAAAKVQRLMSIAAQSEGLLLPIVRGADMTDAVFVDVLPVRAGRLAVGVFSCNPQAGRRAAHRVGQVDGIEQVRVATFAPGAAVDVASALFEAARLGGDDGGDGWAKHVYEALGPAFDAAAGDPCAYWDVATPARTGHCALANLHEATRCQLRQRWDPDGVEGLLDAFETAEVRIVERLCNEP